MEHMGRPSRSLTREDAIEIWQKHWDGWLQSRIAAKLDVNQGRISEVLNEHSHVGSKHEALRVKEAS